MDDFTTEKHAHVLSHHTTNGFLETAVVMAGKALMAEFVSRRKALQHEAQAEETQRARVNHKSPKIVWCPLNLYCRFRKDSLDLGWQQIHYVNKLRSYTYIRRDVNGNYDERGLKKLAKPFEWELVLEFETRSRALRADWKQVVTIRTALRRLSAVTSKPELRAG